MASRNKDERDVHGIGDGNRVGLKIPPLAPLFLPRRKNSSFCVKFLRRKIYYIVSIIIIIIIARRFSCLLEKG